MNESLPSLLEHQKSTVSFSAKEKTKCQKKKKGPWYIPSVTCIPIIVIVILIGTSNSVSGDKPRLPGLTPCSNI